MSVILLMIPHSQHSDFCCSSPWFKKMCKVISNSCVPYTGPAYNAMRTSLLDEVKQCVDKSCDSWIESGRHVTGFVLVCNGSTDAQNQPILNFFLVSPKGAKFLYAVHTSGQSNTAECIAAQLVDVINDIGPQHVSAVIMDDASSNASANSIVQEE